MFASKAQILLLLALLVVSPNLTNAQIPPFVCGILKFVTRIVTGCPNASLMCLFIGIVFNIACSQPEPSSFTPIESALYRAELY